MFRVRLISETLRNTYYLIRDGFRYVRHDDGKTFDIDFIDYDGSDNTYRVVNQFEVGYGCDTASPT